MPKPTFFQAVLSKPSRSYADPYHASPWTDHEATEDSYQPYHTSRYDGLNHAGPSRPRFPRAPGSSISTSAMSDGPAMATSMGTRFPKPARRVVSSVSLRDGQIVHGSTSKDRSTDAKPRRKKERLPTILGEEDQSRPSSAAGGTIKRKKKKPQSVIDDAASSILSSPTSTMSLALPPPIHSTYSETSSSAPSSPVPPLSPTTPTQRQIIHLPAKQHSTTRPATAVFQKASLPLPTPPSSEMSTPNSSSHHIRSPPNSDGRVISLGRAVETSSKQAFKPATAPVIVEPNAETDDENEVFYTPRSSLTDLTLPTSAQEQAQAETPKIRAPFVSPPSFNFMPPTPAPVPDPDASPFHSEPSSSNSSLHPDRPLQVRPSPKISIPSNLGWQNPDIETAEAADDDDIHSASGEVGSEPDEEDRPGSRGSYSRRPSDTVSRPNSRDRSSRTPSMLGTRSVGASSVDGFRPLSRQSTSRHNSNSRNTFEDFVVHHRGPRSVSEASFSSAPNREGSVRGSITGYGKGGWAAAHSARSRPSSPVMLMPTTGDGWAEFQQPPPRQTKFTPLPAASHPPSFDRITNGSRLEGSSARGSQNGLMPPTRTSSPSEYSQLSDDDAGPMPSRSYAKKDYASEASQSSRVSDDEHESGYGNGSSSNGYGGAVPAPLGASLEFPIARLGSLNLSQGRPASSYAQSHITSRPTSPHPMSPVPGFSRPTSPMFSDSSQYNSTTTPRTFNPPSFLNPDLLTILPEMSQEDSERTYRPTPSEGGRSSRRITRDWESHNRSRRSSIFRARSEIGQEDEDELGDLRSVPRSKSVTGYRNEIEIEKKWEGSSYGDGVLMESHGRAPESVGGYTNLILPAGAYRPDNPAKSKAELDSRILGMPHATMASITLSTTFSRHSSTPAHLRDQLPPLVEFASHQKPPTKVGDSQLLLQVYAVAIDQNDVRVLDEKGRADVGKWVPGRSFVGRALVVGATEKEVVRGDIVMGLLDLRKSGALCEYMVVERRRISRAPFPTQLTLEQLAMLPLQGIAAARAVRTHLVRHSRAFIMDAHKGIAALVCQELSRAGVHVTAVIPGGDDSHEAHRACLENGARGVLMGSPAAVMLNMEESAWDYVFDTHGGQRVYDAARRMLKDGGKLVSTVKPENNISSPPPNLTSRPSGLKTLRSAFTSKRKESKFIAFMYLPPSGVGGSEVDTAGMDTRDVMEEACMAIFRPALPEFVPLTHQDQYMPTNNGIRSGEGETGVRSVVHFENGADVFKRNWEGVRVVRVIN